MEKFVSLILVNFLVGRQNADTQVINDALNNGFNTVTKAIVYTLFVIAYLLYLSPKLLGVLFAGLLGLTLVAGFIRRTTSALNIRYMEEKARLVQISEETFSNIRTVKAFANQKFEIKKFDEINKSVIMIGHRRAVWSGISQTLSYACLYFTLAMVTYFGVIWSME